MVNGPELLNKYVGATEEAIRELFADAEEDAAANGEDAELHLIIFDEIDAICKKVPFILFVVFPFACLGGCDSGMKPRGRH